MLKEQITNIIHNICTEKCGIYSTLFFADDLEKIQDFSFSFMFNNDESKTEQDLEQDVNYFIDNIITKYFEINFEINYKTCKPNIDGHNIEFNDIKNNIWFLTQNYTITDETFKMCDLENYISDINVIEQDTKYIIEWKIPIYKIDKSSIIIN